MANELTLRRAFGVLLEKLLARPERDDRFVRKAAISAWRDLLLPALAGPNPPALWPFDGAMLPLLLAANRVVIAETYPAEAMRQLGLRMGGSKRRHADRMALVPALRQSMAALSAAPDPSLDR